MLTLREEVRKLGAGKKKEKRGEGLEEVVEWKEEVG